MGHFGFSYIGVIWLCMLIIPNLLWTKFQPIGYTAENENRLLAACEKCGQVLVSCIAVLFTDFNLRPITTHSIWLLVSFLLMILYECWWIRYFKSAKRLEDFYSGFYGIPLAGAVLPVIAFLLLGIYGNVIWMLLAVLILGIGHIGIHYQHAKNIK